MIIVRIVVVVAAVIVVVGIIVAAVVVGTCNDGDAAFLTAPAATATTATSRAEFEWKEVQEAWWKMIKT